MKRKFILVSFILILLFVVGKTANAITSNELPIGDDRVTAFCQYQGMLNKLDEADKEFEMLLESTNYPNFQSMFTTVSNLLKQVRVSKKYLEMLKNPECNVSKYTKRLLTYYEANKKEIIKNVENENLSQDYDIVTVFESLKKEVGPEFLISITLDKQLKQMIELCPPSPSGCKGSGCSSKEEILEKNRADILRGRIGFGSHCHTVSSLTVIELINTVYEMNNEIEKLKQQIALVSSSKCECSRQEKLNDVKHCDEFFVW